MFTADTEAFPGEEMNLRAGEQMKNPWETRGDIELVSDSAWKTFSQTTS